MKIISRSFAIALAVILAVHASPASSQTQSTSPYELVGIFSTTGPGSFLGTSASASFKAIGSYINANGGINGRQLQMMVLDDQSSPQVAVQLVNDLIAKKTAMIIGPMLTANCNAVQTLVVQGPVAYCVSIYATPPSGGFMFVQGGNPNDGATVTLRYLKERGIKRVAMLNATDATGQVADRATEAAFAYPEFRSMQLVAHLRFAPGDTSVSAQMAQIKAANPQALISWNVGSAFGTVVHGLHDAGLDALPIVAAGGNAAEAQMRALAGFRLDDVHFLASPSFVDDARVPKAVLDQQAQFRKVMAAANLPSDGAHGAPYDITMIEIAALRALPPNPTAEQIKDYISHISHYVGANGVYDFRFGNQSGAGQPILLMVRWDAARGHFVASSTTAGHVLNR